MKEILHKPALFFFLLFSLSAPAQTAPQAGQPEQPKPKDKLTLDQILEKLPRRVTSKTGTPGDMVNFIVLGTRQQLEDSFQAAGWIRVDRNPQDAIQHAISETLEHRAYSQMPMSELYLFGRPQDYGYAEGIPIQVVTQRNHFRLWEAPWQTTDGQTVWVGAGTHDIGIEKDTLGNLTHQIDPNVDKERDYILDSLKDAEKIKISRYVLPPNPVREAATATGGSFRSDGRILIVSLK